MVRRDLIPALCFLRSRYSLKLSDFFPVSFLWRFGCPSQAQCGDLLRCDVLFDMISYQWVYRRPFYALCSCTASDFTKERDQQAWAPGLTHIPSDPDLILNPAPEDATQMWSRLSGRPDLASPTPSIRTVSTRFDPGHKTNREVDYRQNDRKDAYQKTTQERSLAKDARIVHSIDEFEDVVRTIIPCSSHGADKTLALQKPGQRCSSCNLPLRSTGHLPSQGSDAPDQRQK